MITELSVMEQRYQAVLEVHAGVPVVEVAERFGVSRQAMHRWTSRYRDDGLEGLADRSRKPHSSPSQVAAEVEALVCEMRRTHPRWGPRRLRAELARRGVSPLPHRSSIYRMLVRFDLVAAQAAPETPRGLQTLAARRVDAAVADGHRRLLLPHRRPRGENRHRRR